MTPEERFLLFTRVCLPIRLSFVLFASMTDKATVQQMGQLALLPAIGFWFLWLSGVRSNPTEGGRKIWWGALRPLHGTLYALFAYQATTGNWQTAWIYLLADVVVGAAAWVLNEYSSYNTLKTE